MRTKKICKNSEANAIMSKQDRNCQVSTPEKYMEQMLDYVVYKQDLLRMRYSVKIFLLNCIIS